MVFWLHGTEVAEAGRGAVHENGAGLSPNQTHSIDSFGHQFIQTLIARLGAQITYSSDNGTKVDVFSGIT